jgi:hypothetical protein
MKAIRWNDMVTALALVRLGQELGTDSQAARATHAVVELLLAFWRM